MGQTVWISWEERAEEGLLSSRGGGGTPISQLSDPYPDIHAGNGMN